MKRQEPAEGLGVLASGATGELPGVGTYAWSVAEDRLVWSPELVRIYGLEGAPPSERGFTALVHPEDRTRVEGETSTYLSSGDSYAHEFRIVRPDGAVRLIHDRGVVERAEDGSAVCIRGINVDVTDHRAPQPAHAGGRHAELLQLALDAADQGVWDYDIDNDEPVWDEATYRLFGRAPGTPLRYDVVVDEFVHPDDRERVTAAAEAALDPAGDGRYVVEHRVVAEDGSVRWLAVEGRTRFAGPAGERRPVRMLGTVRDVTGARRTEAALREADEVLRMALEAGGIGVWRADFARGEALVDEATRSMLDLEGGEERRSIGEIEDRIHPDDLAHVRAAWLAVPRGGTMRSEFRVVGRDGRERVILGMGTKPVDGEGRHVATGVNVDVTEDRARRRRLEESEARLSAAIEAGAVGVHEFHPVTGEIVWNHTVREIWGLSPDEKVTYETFRAGIHPDDLEATEAAVAAAFDPAGGGRYDTTYRVINRRSGELRWVHADGDVSFEDGRPVRLVGTVIDMTERVAAERRMRENEARLKRVLDQIFAFVGLLSPDGTLVYANRAPLEAAGLSLNDIVGMPFEETPWWSHDGRTRARIRGAIAAAAAGARERFDVTAWMAGEHAIAIDFQIAPLVGADGTVEGLIVSAVDVDERAAAERALRQSEARASAAAQELQAIYDSAPIGIVLFDRDFRFLRINRRLASMNRTANTDHLGRTIEEVLPADTAAALRAVQHRLLAGEEVSGLETPSTDPLTGQRRTHLVSYVPLREEDGAVEAFLGTVLEITDRKRAEDRLAASEERQRIAARAAGFGIFEWNVREDAVVWENGRMFEIFGHRIADGTVSRAVFVADYLHPEDARGFEGALSAALAGGALEATCRIRRTSDREVRWVEFVGTVEFGPDGAPDRLIGVCADVTRRKRATEQRRLLIAELNHRVKNTLAIVQSIANQSLVPGTSAEEQRTRFQARLHALAAAHDILTREDWEKAALADLVADVVAACGVEPARFDAEGPPITLSPQRAVMLGLALHELCTNALKYGALSAREGRVSLVWEAIGEEAGGFRMTWRERGGPAIAAPPEREGFGSRMLKRALSAELGAAVEMDYRPEGLTCVVRANAPPRARKG